MSGSVKTGDSFYCPVCKTVKVSRNASEYYTCTKCWNKVGANGGTNTHHHYRVKTGDELEAFLQAESIRAWE